MGSIMDRERPWEREEKKELKTITDRVEYYAVFGPRSMIDQLVTELERMQKELDALKQTQRIGF
ncbi:hypothetical protein EVB55_157 [Rhizobium phage RHph_Y68]|uniref:Uncharacterized protein n=1 Tax=Rhizobium phage RHph_Y68 TaxID=2509787 RepID=A0A7S5QY99_9CAUD|nr:hypothetical protein PP934_gp157 [Rhizobium phage RHph_Y68]QIG68092.1 hypothetical protein EVB55_157 [Rhizobium phage RHph_Y68]